MATIFNTLFLLPLLFISGCAQIWKEPNAYKIFNQKHVLGPHELFGDPFGNPFDYKNSRIPDDFGTPILVGEIVAAPGKPSNADTPSNSPVDLGYKGDWELVSQNSGVSAMHAILLPKTDKVLMYDATIWKISKLPLPNDECRVLNKTTGDKDCWCHSVLFDIKTSELTPLELHTDTWCSSGGLDVNGNLVSTGGYQGGANTVRYLSTCVGCNWREYPTALADRRWYSTQATLPDGGYIVVGGRDAFSYEYIPAEGKSNAKPYFFDFLRQTSDPEENNLYPFVFLSTDGNVFIFANSRSVLLNPKSNKIVREFPVLPGGHRNYPASAMCALLPIKLHAENQQEIPSEVLICGGSAHRDAYSKAEKHIFYTALQDCARIKITAKDPVWKRELMPTPRIMGDMMILPTGDVLLLNGAKRGASGWGFAREPNFTPVLYNPRAKRGLRFTELAPSNIARMYHSSSAVLPDGKVLVGGSNTNNGYIYDAIYPTELRIEKYSPPYLNANLAAKRPEIVVVLPVLFYGGEFMVQIKLKGLKVEQQDLKVTMYAPAFTTHGVSMNQRLIDLGLKKVESNPLLGLHSIASVAPPSSTIAPPGYYMLSVVYQGVPSVSKWVQIK
ncbi:Galactose oxidase precursor, putative [Ricinus communis]|uniref:Galactose oxidase, putative n=1 Tax=Ricinus communis TaxID=3988 RepID=B9RKL6_RICCO|nr:Galactose oxidase precursor, putative [Ricinus communis]|eukprot:XP_002514260.1 aldehyde oxidase GLOX1 [Ricinus communis]